MDFVFSSDEELTGEDISNFIEKHKGMVPRYLELKKQYESKPPILDMEEKETWKPDNRLVVNFGKYIVDTFNGYFSGIPIKISHEDEILNETINTFWNRNNLDDTISELSKMTSQYGKGYLYVFQNEEAETKVVYSDPFNTFIIYDDTIERNPLYGVRYWNNADGEMKGTLLSLDSVSNFYRGDDGIVFEDEKPNYYPTLPIIEFVENEERQSLIEPVESLINAYNKALSEKANDTDYFADAYLAILGAELDEDGTHKIRDNRIINMFGTDDATKIVVEFLDKPDGDVTQENLLDRLERLIYHTSMVANINDESFGNASGVSLEFKLQPMKNLASMKERKFVKGLNQLLRIFLSLPTNTPSKDMEEWSNIQFRFTRNIPRNIQDEAKTAAELEGVVSKETQLSVLSIVDNPKEEIRKIEEEKPDIYESNFELDSDLIMYDEVEAFEDGLDG